MLTYEKPTFIFNKVSEKRRVAFPLSSAEEKGLSLIPPLASEPIQHLV